MNFYILTLFPQMVLDGLRTSVIGRAEEKVVLSLEAVVIRDFAGNKHNRVDDTPYGGGKGMVMQPEPIYRCYLDIIRQSQSVPYVIYMSPQGAVLTEGRALELREYPHLLLLCGHYEGVDERILTRIVNEEISIGDYVLTGGELGALVLTDAVVRLCDGVLAADICFEEESHMNGLLEYPQYTRPEVWDGMEVPEVLRSGHHAKIEAWRHQQSLDRTAKKRPDMMRKYRKQGLK